MRLAQEGAEAENNENENANVKSSKVSQYEPLCHELERNFKLRASDEK